MNMKRIMSTIILPITLLLTACNKTEQPTTTTTNTTNAEMEVDVEVDNGEIIVKLNGEKQVIDLSEFMGDIDPENMDGEVSIAVMAVINEDENEPTHTMKWMSSEDVDFHPQMKAHAMQMRAGHGGPPEGMEERRVRQGRSGHSRWQEGFSQKEQEGSEIREFIHELNLLGDVSSYLDESDSVAMMGIHMIRDELEGDIRMASLETIIEEVPRGVPSRNAALIIAIQTMQEEGNIEAAADYMIELVLSN